MMGARLTETAAESGNKSQSVFVLYVGFGLCWGALLGAISKLTISSVAHCWCHVEAERKD